MRILVLGAGGMLGRAVARVQAQDRGRGSAPDREIIERDHAGCDIADPVQVNRVLADCRPHVVLLCAAYTNVDGAEADEAGARRVNGEGAGVVAQACAAFDAHLIFPSTDYVFDGAQPEPYREDDLPAPINAYGRTKLLGEQRVRASGCSHLIARTSWVYGPQGKHFVAAILARARSGQPLSVVIDQVGAPTYTIDLAQALLTLAERGIRGTLHVTNRGWCTWHQFAARILALAGIAAPIAEITSDTLARPARRPRNSRLDGSRLAALGIAMPSWEDALARFLKEHDASPAPTSPPSP